MFTLPMILQTKEGMEEEDMFDYSIFYTPYLLVEILREKQLLDHYKKGFFPYKKELALLKIAQTNRRNNHASVVTTRVIKSFSQDIRSLDRGALLYFEELEHCILDFYHFRCTPIESFDNKKYSTITLDIAKMFLEKKDWPPDFFSKTDL